MYFPLYPHVLKNENDLSVLLFPFTSHFLTRPLPLTYEKIIGGLENGDLKVGIQSKAFQEAYTLATVAKHPFALLEQVFLSALPVRFWLVQCSRLVLSWMVWRK